MLAAITSCQDCVSPEDAICVPVTKLYLTEARNEDSYEEVGLRFCRSNLER